MPLPLKQDAFQLSDRLRDAQTMGAALMADLIEQGCHRLSAARQTGKVAQLERVIAMGAWTDAALMLIDLELPQWQIRRIAYDEGEWFCALSRERELPDWLDKSIEARHADLPLAILTAFVDARRATLPNSQTSVPTVPQDAGNLYDPVICDNFG
jgi:hypothetical protein